MKDAYSAKELAEILGISVQAVHKRASAKKAPWAYREEPNGQGGGVQKLYLYASLPRDVRDKVDAHELRAALERAGESCAWPHPVAVPGNGGGQAGESTALVPLAGAGLARSGKSRANGSWSGGNFGGNGNTSQTNGTNGTTSGKNGTNLVIASQSQAPKAIIIPKRADDIGLAKYRLIHAWRDMAASQPWGKKCDATQVFLTAYHSGELLPGVYHTLKDISEKTLYQLDKKLRQANDDYHALCDGRGGWKKHGTTHWKERSLPKFAQDALLACYLLPNKPTFRLAHLAAIEVLKKQGLTEEGFSVLPGEASWRRWLGDWEKRHHDLLVLGREGEKAYIDQCAPYITRDASKLEVGQVLVADGHDLNFEILHPETGRPCRMKLIVFFDWASRYPVGWQIMPTENVTAILAALRSAIMRLGKYPSVVYLDNGKAFKAKIFTNEDVDLEDLRGIYSRLGIATIFAEPYRARSKVVERFFLTVGMQCEELVPSYCGGSIEDKPAWRARNEKFHQAWHEARTQGWVPNIREAAHLISLYFKWYGESPHEGIGKRRPVDVLLDGVGPGVDLAELNYQFLWRIPVTPRRCRARLYGIDYESDCLHGLKPEKGAVIAHVDMADLSRIYCYLPNGEYLGEALPVQALPPIARILGDEIGVDQVQAALKRQRRLARDAKEKLIALGVTTEEAATVTALPWQQRVTVIQGGKSEGSDPDRGEPDAGGARLRLVYERIQEEAEKPASEPEPKIPRPEYFRGEIERYDWCFRCVHEHGQALSEPDERFMAWYETEPEFQESYRQRYEDLMELFSLYKT